MSGMSVSAPKLLSEMVKSCAWLSSQTNSFSHRTERFTAGDGIITAGVENERHKVKVTGSVARLILVEAA
jgi:hypothetical protein